MINKNIRKIVTSSALLIYCALIWITTVNRTYNHINIYASTLEPVETTIATNAASPQTTIRPTNTPTIKPSPTPKTTATPPATIEPAEITTPIEDTIEPSPTPIPTFNLNQPGQVVPQGTTIPTAQTQNQENNTAIIMGIIGGVLIIVGIGAIMLQRKKSNEQNIATSTTRIPQPPLPHPPVNTNPNQPIEQQYTTPYDQYLKNQNNN